MDKQISHRFNRVVGRVGGNGEVYFTDAFSRFLDDLVEGVSRGRDAFDGDTASPVSIAPVSVAAIGGEDFLPVSSTSQAVDFNPVSSTSQAVDFNPVS